MRLGMVGLGKMGLNMTERLLNGGHEVVVYDLNRESVGKASEKGAIASTSIQNLVEVLGDTGVIWVMVPAGDSTQKTISHLTSFLKEGATIIDGGNSNYKDTMQRAKILKNLKISLLDVGTSGGVWGLDQGYCLMIGGSEEAFLRNEEIFKTLAPSNGYQYVGATGSGHYVKMVHNGIEYGMLQAYAEGFEILNSKKEFNFDLEKISNLWNNGSVIRSWLLELAENVFKNGSDLNDIKGYVEDSGEGRWTVQEAIDQSIPAPVITLSLLQRFVSRQEESYSAKVVAALRNEFGGHGTKKVKK